ncbi:GSCFA domain-containing protein [Pontibacter sp. KCTC 32443]|uniref:GSCFA domain-containing protein n=1 Tax=Pontibacter TaxID=323449 RepID=UPI00164E0806|nr:MULTISPECIES: GSCFA domain-containing protein [Pontibacter]MBC5773783.1 GSCFA domain-containing protein [Pontibacter sp. KCTC 32443]
MFRTEVHIPSTGINLQLHDKVVTIGSCFAEVIGTKLREYKADVVINPFGTIFNPISVGRLLQAVAGGPFNLEQNLVLRDGIWYSYDLHSSLSSPDKNELLQLIEARIEQTREHLSQAKLLIITLGTAVSYKLADTGNIVANCHKLAAKQFSRTLLTIEEITESIEVSYHALKKLNPELQLILTVSPVRHVKETLLTNSVSKSILRVATHYLTEQHQDILYFPAYEIMLDDLRDYRFYGPDMLHPTPTAEDYIWQKFIAAYLHPLYQEFLPAWEKIRRAVAHRPFHPHAEAHQSFLNNTLAQLKHLSVKYNISTEMEELVLRQQLTST